MKVLITGAEGFIGGILAKHCRDAGSTVFGIGIKQPGAAWSNGGFEHCDVRDAVHLSELLSDFRPDRIFHLAAQSYPTVSLTHPLETLDSNVVGTANLFECVRTVGIRPVVVVACSSAEYGFVASEDMPVREIHPLRPLHPYGVSKVGQDLLAAQYFTNYGLHTVRIRIFNTTGPGKIGDVCSDLTKRAVEIEMGQHPPFLRVGNLTTRRAIADVRDLVRGLWMSAEFCEPGEVYNVGGDQIYSVEEIVDMIRKHLRTDFTITQDPQLMRACDEPVIAGDTTKFRTCSGWKPEIGLNTIVPDMLDWWRKRLTTSSEPTIAGGVTENLRA